ncbi:hypothetical protein FRC07_004477 [Ceratobasidium sp. 392]|nr:hypothetical protein FRC07_004477 [Ceratobasidium sp. 392]
MHYPFFASVLFLASGMVTARPFGEARSQNIAGAVYFITNEPSGNNVIVNTIDHSGKLSYSHAVPTGGKGLHGNSTGGGPDGLFSQDSVKVGQNMLFTVNPGSNTVTMFRINYLNPSEIHMPVSSGGEFPISIAFSEHTKEVCVLNGGRINGVQCYWTDMIKGLIPIPNTKRSLGLNQTTPATGAPGSASDVVFSANGEELYVSVKGMMPTPGFVATYKVNKADGSLSDKPVKTTPASGGLSPFSMTLIPYTKALLATDPAVGFAIYDFSKGSPADSTTHPVANQRANCWSALSYKTGNIYLVDTGLSTVTEVHVDRKLNANVVNQYPLGLGSGTIDSAIVSVGEHDFMYVLSANATSVDVLSLNGPGKATHLQRLNIQSAVASSGSQIPINRNNLQGMAAYVMAKSK